MGKRDIPTTNAFLEDLAQRVINKPEISSDAYLPYPRAVDRAFGMRCTYGQIIKTFAGDATKEAQRRYSPGYVVAVEKRAINGSPQNISTSYVERSNLTIRMHARRFTRLTNAFSKKLENHVAAVGLFVAHYNLCRVHETIRVTPAMQLGVADHVWSVGELLDAALTGNTEAPRGRRVGRFTLIDGGLS